jgi:hypothetical protein
MKILTFFLTLSIVSITNCLAQGSATLSSKEILLQKSKKQQKTGLIMLIGGPVAAVGGGVLLVGSGPNSFGETMGAILFFSGASATVASIPVLIISRNIKDRAEELSFGSTPVFLLKYANTGPKSFPSLKLSIPL